LLFALGVCAIAGALSGCAPAWQAARANLTDAIKEGGRAIGGGRHLLRRVLVVLEFALALTLLASGGIAAHAFIKTMNVDLGFRADHLLTMQLPVTGDRFDTPEEVEASTVNCSIAPRPFQVSGPCRSPRACRSGARRLAAHSRSWVAQATRRGHRAPA
jgi:hypothetical protein